MSAKRRWPVRVLVAVLVAGVVWLLLPLPSRSAEWRASADAIAQRDFGRAMNLLDAHLARWPSHAEGHLRMAQTARRGDDYPRAESHLRTYQSLGGSAEILGRERVLIGIQRGELPASDGVLALADAFALEAIARGDIRTRRYDKAIACLDRYEKLPISDADRTQSLIWRGDCAFLRGDIGAAAEAFRTALDRDPANLVVRVRLAKCLVRTDPSAAKPLIDALMRDRPTDPVVRLIAAEYSRTVGDFEAAGGLLDQLARESPNAFAVLIERAELALDRNQPDAAEGLLRAADLARPGSMESLVARARLARARGDQGEAKRLEGELRKLHEAQP